MVYEGIIPEITVEDDHYIYHEDGRIFNKRLNRFLKLTKNNYGYLQVCINGKQKYVHRVIFEKFIGEIPDGFDVDHINNIRDDNRLENLQLLSHNKNTQKRLINKNNTSGFQGVSFNKKNGKWFAQLKYNNKQLHLGYFETQEEASDYRDAYAHVLNEFEGCKYILNCDRE